MGKLKIERIGGLGGYGGMLSHLKSRGELNTDQLTPKDKQAVDELFTNKPKSTNEHMADGFRYKITREAEGHVVEIVVDEDAVPQSLKNCVKDEII